jgi:hypothetical protein
MHWHHLRPAEKEATLGYLAKCGSRQRVLDEIDKCELVCANCHAVRTFVAEQRSRSGEKEAA